MNRRNGQSIFIGCAIVILGLSGIALAADVKPTRSATEKMAVERLEEFAACVNSGLIERATDMLPSVWKFDVDATGRSTSLSELRRGVGNGGVVVIGKRRTRELVPGSIEVQCVCVWSSAGHQFTYNERFVFSVANGHAEMMAAPGLRTVLRHGTDVAALRRELAQIQ
jgi:hypothetical protein